MRVLDKHGVCEAYLMVVGHFGGRRRGSRPWAGVGMVGGGVLVLGAWHVDGPVHLWPGISLILRVKGLTCEKATAALNKAGVVCAGAPLGWWLR